MNVVTTIANDVIDIILRLFGIKKGDPELVEGEEILTEEEVLAHIPDSMEMLNPSDERDTNANSEPLKLDSEEPSASDTSKNSTDPDAELIALKPNTPILEIPIDIAANEPKNTETRNLETQNNPQEPTSNEQTNRTAPNKQAAPDNRLPDGLDELAKQTIPPLETDRQDRVETSGLEIAETTLTVSDIPKPKSEQEDSIASDSLQISETGLTEELRPKSQEREIAETTLTEGDMPKMSNGGDVDIVMAKTDLSEEIRSEPKTLDNLAELEAVVDTIEPPREIITSPFLTSDDLAGFNVMPTSENPSMDSRLKDVSLEAPLEGLQITEFSSANKISMGMPMDEPLTTGIVKNDFHAAGANDKHFEVDADRQVTIQLASGNDLTQPTHVEPLAAEANAATAPTFGA